MAAPVTSGRKPKKRFYLRRHLRTLELARAAILRRKKKVRDLERKRDRNG